MRRFLILILVFLGLAVPVFAEQSPQEQITLLETQKLALQWEFRYCQARMDALQFTAEKIENEIAALKSKIDSDNKGGEK